MFVKKYFFLLNNRGACFQDVCNIFAYMIMQIYHLDLARTCIISNFETTAILSKNNFFFYFDNFTISVTSLQIDCCYVYAYSITGIIS